MYQQPKLNGLKVLAVKLNPKEILYLSNGGKQYTTLHRWTPELLLAMDVGEIWDGEACVHGMMLQDIAAAVKKENADTPRLEYWVYDKVADGMTFHDRLISITTSIIGKNIGKGAVRLTPTQLLDAIDRETGYKGWVSKKFEGTIERDPAGLYEKGKRSKYALKRKDFKDEEFRIIGAEQDVYGRVIWVCATDEGKSFSVVPKGPDDKRKLWYINRDNYLGDDLMVTYLEKSKDGIPQGNPVGEVIRDYE